MTFPTIHINTLNQASTSGYAVDLPTAAGGAVDPATNDILLLIIETANEAVSITADGGGTWTEVTNSPQGNGTGGGSSATRLTVFWSRFNGSQTSPTISDSGDHQQTLMALVRGCKTTGDPFNITSGGNEGSDTSLDIDGATTTAADCLVLVIATLHVNNATALFGTTWTNSDLANITIFKQVSTNQGNDGQISIVTGEKASAGAYGTTSNTLQFSQPAIKAYMTIAMEPAAGGGGGVVKTINGLAIASVKTHNGLAVASVKTINGTAYQ